MAKMQVVIRKATRADFAGMYNVTLRAHAQAYSGLIPKEYWQQFTAKYTFSQTRRKRYISKRHAELADKKWRLWVAELNGTTVGYTVQQWVNKEVVQLRGLFVDPDHFGQGVGTKLFKKSIEDVGPHIKVRLLVLEGNLRAKHMYKKYGFKKVGIADKKFFGARQEVMEKASH